MNATEVFVPPTLILPRKRMNTLLYRDAPNGTLALISDIGCMNSHLFIDWLKHFVKHAKPSAEDPVLLIADNHSSHCSLPAVLFCRENHITFLTLPPHASHVLQPLDKCFVVPLKALYSSEAEKWLIQSPGKVITMYEVSGTFQEAYRATSRVQLAEKAFQVTVTLAPLDNDCTVAVAPKENEVSPSTSQIDVSIQSNVPLPRHEQRGAKRESKSQKSQIMTSTPFQNLLEKNEKEKVELEEAKANRALQKNKNGDKTKKGKALKAKKKLILNAIENPVPSASSANNEGIICPDCKQTYDEDWIQCGLCKECVVVAADARRSEELYQVHEPVHPKEIQSQQRIRNKILLGKPQACKNMIRCGLFCSPFWADLKTLRIIRESQTSDMPTKEAS
ncbi:hypothetical protein AVEN_154905-1 [Araneus ventricosus]|uniref:DDE-1 domain-containing protein n=1 Tax=Araneus ventricosus TaxID=182803 RepID=A0A4Y2A6W7_ARAVE|nr:hypothetical protein AVEN_154905-1 [Araneus ventricosus]